MKYKNPCATADVIIEEENKVLLIQRKHTPFIGMWALPGGHLNYGRETLKEAAARELREETSLVVKVSDLELMGVYSNPKRDPRGHYITHVYVTKSYSGIPKANDDAKQVGFFPLDNLPKLAFDHEKILGDYKGRFKNATP